MTRTTQPRNDASHALLHGSASPFLLGRTRVNVLFNDRGQSPLRAFIIALALTFASQTFAVELPESCRVVNRGGRCVASNLATLGRYHRIPALADLAPDGIVEGKEGLNDDDVRDLLKPRGIHWRGHDHGTFDRELLPLANSHGVIVSMRYGTPWPTGGKLVWNHSIILTRYTRDGVGFICPNHPGRTFRASHAWFDGEFGGGWNGNSMVFGGDE